MSAKDDLTIFLNVMAQSPQGLDDPQLIGKFSKAKAQLHVMDSMNTIQNQMVQPSQPVIPQNNAPTTPNEPIGATNAPESTNTPPQMNEGQGSLNLP